MFGHRQNAQRSHDAWWKNMRSHITSLGGTTILSFRIARAICVFVLLGLYAYDLARAPLESLRTEDGLELALFLTYVRLRSQILKSDCSSTS